MSTIDIQPLSLDPTFGKLGREIRWFANHTGKMLTASQKHRLLLEEAAAWSEGTAPIDQAPADPVAALRAIDKFARIRRIRRPMLFGAYFAHHYLRTQAEMSRELLRESLSPNLDEKSALFFRAYEHAESLRRQWVSGLLELAISAAAPELSKKDYAAFNVGALVDHEDVDLAIVVRNEEARRILTKGFSGVTKTFVRYASKIQMFLTEEMTTPRICALVEEYSELLERPAQNIVSVMQLLSAQFLCGNPNLARRLEEQIIRPYYAGEGEPMVHEGFLRSVMAELRHYSRPASRTGVLVPKREIYVPAKLATTAARVVHGVHETRPPHALRLIARIDPERAAVYETLAKAFVRNEVLRALMFLYVSHGDDFDLLDPDIEATTKRVALLMGARRSARRSYAARLLGNYTESRTRALRAIAMISDHVHAHLIRVSTFRKLIERHQDPRYRGDNLPLTLVTALERYRDSVFWEEVVELLDKDDTNGLRFVEDFKGLFADGRWSIAGRYVALMCDHADALVHFLIYLAKQDAAYEERCGYPTERNADTFWDAMMEHLRMHRSSLSRFIDRLDTETTAEALYHLATCFSTGQLADLAELIESYGHTSREQRVVRALRSVIILGHHRSNYVGRTAQRVMKRTPQFLARLGAAKRLKEMGNEILAAAAKERNPVEQVELLGDSFDVALLRSALIGVLDGAPADLDPELTTAVDQYVRELFKACFREVRERSPMFTHYRPGQNIALFATGGYGRGEAFGSDFDYIAVANDNDRGLKKFFGKVLQRVSSAMSRRGLHPHNRFTEPFHAYVVSIPELVQHLENRTEETFIDEAEILDARFFLGDPKVARRFRTEVRERITNAHGASFVRDLLDELRNRRTALPLGLNVKEGAGGLREIHLLGLALRVFCELPAPFSAEFLPKVLQVIPEIRGDLRFLLVANAELRRARELYRLVVAFDDTIDDTLLVESARDLPPLAQAGVRDDFGRELEKLLAAAAMRIDRVAFEIERRLKSDMPPS